MLYCRHPERVQTNIWAESGQTRSVVIAPQTRLRRSPTRSTLNRSITRLASTETRSRHTRPETHSRLTRLKCMERTATIRLMKITMKVRSEQFAVCGSGLGSPWAVGVRNGGAVYAKEEGEVGRRERSEG